MYGDPVYINSRYTSSLNKYKSYFFTKSLIWFISRRVYRYPVGLLGLHIKIARVLSLISSSNFSTLGSEKPSSIVVAIVRITAPAATAKAI